MTGAQIKSWLSKNWLWILIILILGFLLYVLFHKSKIYEFGAQKTIDSLYLVVTTKNRIDSITTAKLKDSIKAQIITDSANKEKIVKTSLQVQVANAQVALLTYKLKHTAAGTPIDSTECIKLADKVDSMTALEAIKDNEYQVYTSGLERHIGYQDSVNNLQALHIQRTDSAYAYTKNQADTCAVDNKKMVKQVKRQSLVTKIAAGFAIVFLGIVISDHIK